MFSQRYPDFFDGIVAGNPGMDLPKAAVAEAWDSQAFAAAARTTTPFGNPDLASSFTPAELTAVGNAILQACDAQDGVVDGMVFNPHACRFDPQTLGPAGQRRAVGRAGHRARKGVRRRQELARPLAVRGLVLGSGHRGTRLAGLEDRPAVPGAGQHVAEHHARRRRAAVHLHHATQLGHRRHRVARQQRRHHGRAEPRLLGPERFVRALGARASTWTPTRRRSSRAARSPSRRWTSWAPSSTDYRRFRRGGSKLIVYSGQADPVFSTQVPHPLVQPARRRQRRPASHARLRASVRGAGHEPLRRRPRRRRSSTPSRRWSSGWSATRRPTVCSAPPAADTPWPGRTRPLCAYPEHARYKGHGSIEDAASFVCVAHAR